ncbi:hypothetical protein TNCV_4980241 [Trichonephila clavipes]|nr:hypothetical protein TNCV_4980241 [Trichonephila clavipes]
MTPFELLFGTKMKSCQDIEIVELLNDEITAQFQEQRDALRQDAKSKSTKTGLVPSDNLKIIELKDLITNSDRYDEEFVKDVLSVIVEKRTATEKQKASGKKAEKQKAVVVAQQREREFELEKKIQLEMQRLSQANS